MQKDSEENNEMIFCDSCNICVHQVGVCVCVGARAHTRISMGIRWDVCWAVHYSIG